MKLNQMRECVLNELNYISKGPLPQGELRVMYWTKRMHSLGKKAISTQTAREVLDKYITYLKKTILILSLNTTKSFLNTNVSSRT